MSTSSAFLKTRQEVSVIHNSDARQRRANWGTHEVGAAAYISTTVQPFALAREVLRVCILFGTKFTSVTIAGQTSKRTGLYVGDEEEDNQQSWKSPTFSPRVDHCVLLSIQAQQTLLYPIQETKPSWPFAFRCRKQRARTCVPSTRIW
eukprot:3319532-Rhodomonas_salina.1